MSPRRARTTSLLVVALLLGGVALVAAAALLATSSPSRYRVAFTDDTGGCTAYRAAGTEASATVTVTTKNVYWPRITSKLTVRVPAASLLGASLVHAEDDPRRRTALRCLLGMGDAEQRSHEWRDQLPVVSQQGDRITVEDTVRTDVSSQPDNLRLGLATLRMANNGHWRLTLRAPEALEPANWQSVKMIAPRNWIVSPHPWPPAYTQSAEVGWDRPTGAESDGYLASVGLDLDAQTRILLATQSPPWQVLTLVMYWFTGLALAPLALMLTYRARRRFAGSTPGVPPDDPAPSAGTSMPVATARAVRLLLPTVALMVAQAVDTLSRDRVNTAFNPSGELYDWALGVLAVLVIGGTAVCWHLPPPTVATVVAGCLTLQLGIQIVVEQDWAGMRTADGAEARAVLVLQSGAAFLAGALFFTGLINMCRLLIVPGGAARPARWTWIVGTLVAAILVVERLIIADINADRRNWLSAWSDSPIDQCCQMGYYPWDLLDEMVWLLLAVATIAIYNLLRAQLRTGATEPDLVLVTFLFVLGPLVWEVDILGVWLPLWPLSWLLLWLTLRGTPPLDRPLRDGQTMRVLLDTYSIPELRALASRWRRLRQRGRALDRAFTRGEATVADYHQAGTGPRPDGIEYGVAMGTDALAVRADAGIYHQFLRPNAGATPVDLVIALGPGTTPLGNARIAMRVMLWLSLPAIVLTVWLSWRAYPLMTSDHQSSVLVALGADVIWQAVTFVFTGAVLGLLWRRLPFRRGPLKALPLLLVHAVVTLVLHLNPRLLVGVPDNLAIINFALFASVVMSTALVMDYLSLRPDGQWWARPQHALLAAYGAENISAQFTFLLAQAAAVLAIVAFIDGNGEVPSYPSIDPFHFGR
ncbi:DUF6185 family protein [Plantactinospora sp. ZYX-F-223]|uniref:DUF6185 family protein n=1 Tax=Plantactinospora sp. ZYX-F-223 TaxID=3144103 RepID=UPI0031FE2455